MITIDKELASLKKTVIFIEKIAKGGIPARFKKRVIIIKNSVLEKLLHLGLR